MAKRIKRTYRAVKDDGLKTIDSKESPISEILGLGFTNPTKVSPVINKVNETEGIDINLDSIIHSEMKFIADIAVLRDRIDAEIVEENPTFFDEGGTIMVNDHSIHITGNIDTIPEMIQEHPDLKTLNISGTDIRQLPSWFSDLTKLEYLTLANNKITQIDEEVWSLTNIIELDISSNDIESLPIELPKLKKMKRLDLSQNKLDNRDNELSRDWQTLSKLENLKELDLSYGYQGSEPMKIPSKLRKLKNLRWFGFAGNRLNKIPKLTKLRRLEFIDLSDNEIEDFSPLGDAKSLKSINISKNSIEKFPDSLNRIKTLRVLDISHNRLKKLPKSFTDFKGMKRLDISDNPEFKLGAELKDLKLNELNISNTGNTDIPIRGRFKKKAALPPTLQTLYFAYDAPPDAKSYTNLDLLKKYNRLTEIDVRGHRFILNEKNNYIKTVRMGYDKNEKSDLESLSKLKALNILEIHETFGQNIPAFLKKNRSTNKPLYVYADLTDDEVEDISRSLGKNITLKPLD